MANEKITTIVLTKKVLLHKVNNDMTSYRKFLVHFKARIDERWFYRRKDVVTIYDEDLFEFAEKDHLSKKEYDRITNELVLSCISGYSGENINYITQECNKHIEQYNEYCRRCAW